MKKILYTLVAASLVLSSCGISDLEDRVGKVENLIGSNQPISIDYATTDYNDDAVTKKTSFSFKSTDWQTAYCEDYGDGTYDIYIERFSDVDWQDGAWIDFYYDSNTGETTVYDMGAYFEHENGRYQDASFYDWAGENTRTVTVTSFNAATGKINLTATATSTTAYSYNEYSEHEMELTLKFNGTVGVFEGND